MAGQRVTAEIIPFVRTRPTNTLNTRDPASEPLDPSDVDLLADWDKIPSKLAEVVVAFIESQTPEAA